MAQRPFAIGALFYGDFPAIRERLLRSWESLLDWALVANVRLGFNAVPEPVRQDILRRVRDAAPACVPVLGFQSDHNVCKYPLLRRMIYDPTFPLDAAADYLLWFDDDSALDAPGVLPGLLQRFHAGVTLLGAIFRMRPRGQMAEYVRQQPWYTGKPIVIGQWHPFITGGCWAAPVRSLTRWDYPWPALRHRGGDLLLGVLCRQQGYAIRDCRQGLIINADIGGRISKAQRRGVNEPMLGELPPPYSLAHQDFAYTIEVHHLGVVRHVQGQL